MLLILSRKIHHDYFFNHLHFRDEDPEKLIKSEDGSAVAVSAQAPPTMPHVPITTPPPPIVGADMNTQAGYGGYSSWYQVHMIPILT